MDDKKHILLILIKLCHKTITLVNTILGLVVCLTLFFSKLDKFIFNVNKWFIQLYY